MDRNTVIGLTLIFGLFFTWQYVTSPSKEELQAAQQAQDSIARASQVKDSLAKIKSQSQQKAAIAIPDSLRQQQVNAVYGIFGPSALGTEQEVSLENDLMKVTFSTRGGRIKKVLLKQHYKMVRNNKKKDVREPLILMDASKDVFSYTIPVRDAKDGELSTGNLYFQPEITGNTLVMRANAADGGYFEQKYTLSPSDYTLDYRVRLESNTADAAKTLTLNWKNYLHSIEKSSRYERTYATAYMKPEGENVLRCSPTKESDQENSEGAAVRWVSSANQFFNSALIADTPFKNGSIETKSMPEGASYLKTTTTVLELPIKQVQQGGFGMKWYIGPNEFNRLYTLGNGLEEVVPFGRSILGTINRWVIRPIFNLLSKLSLGAGMVIFLLTLLVKLVLYPLTYRMIYSQSKMSALKPEMEKLKEKFKDDQQRQQMETMNLYREFGVNPLGSCMPMLLQMPIWFALYRFFPASIEFRQKGFWWASDLSSYDEFFQLPFSIPLGFGDHISMFTLLWVLTTLIYTWYNSQNMDFSANPALKYMQYVMPVMFMGFFNGYASGLTAYLLFSNVINIGQTLVTKNWLIDEEKIKREMENFRKKPKSKKGFTARLEQALKDQQQIAEQKQAALKKKK
ncbi:MAG: membrane protein insertase YidC [Haliscomenobacter sp.]